MSRSSDGDSSSRGETAHAWESLGEKELVHTPIFTLVSRRLRHPKRGNEGDFFVLKTRDWVNVVPVTPSYEMVLVRQYRFGVEELSWEIPGGVMDAGENPLVAGARELREETGFVAEKCELIGNVAANPAILDNRCHFVWAQGVRQESALEWDEHEELEIGVFHLLFRLW